MKTRAAVAFEAKKPLEIVPVERQREALTLLEEQVFSDKPFSFSPELYNQLAASQWEHWGTDTVERSDYPVHDIILMWQDRILSRLMSPLTLDRLHDSELKVPADGDVYTLAEHMKLVVDAVFTEWRKPAEGEHTARKPMISTFRRQLQRMAVKELASFVTNGAGVPEDARTLARMHLSTLDGQIDEALKNDKVKLDDYSKAHLLDSQRRIRQVLNAELDLRSIE